MEGWNVGTMVLPIIPLFQYSNPEEFDVVLVPLLTQWNPYFKGGPFIDLTFYRDLSMMV